MHLAGLGGRRSGTNTQLFNTLDEHDWFKIGEAVTSPWSAPEAATTPTMDGFVTGYISTFTGEVGRQPTYDEHAQIMTGYAPEQVPVLCGIARSFGMFDHWFSEVPSQTFMNRSFWTAASSSGLVVNSPVKKWMAKNTAETIFERLHRGPLVCAVPAMAVPQFCSVEVGPWATLDPDYVGGGQAALVGAV